jgi:hypothetical protein
MRAIRLFLLIAVVSLLVGRDSNAQVARLQNDTLRFPACGEGVIFLEYLFAGCDGAATDSVVVGGLPATEFEIKLGQRFLRDGEADTSRIRFFSKRSGIYPVTIFTSVRHGDWLREDTTFNIIVIVDPSPGILSSNVPDTIDFGKQSLCVAERIVKQIDLSNMGCEDINIKSIRIELDQQPATEFVFTNASAITLKQGEPMRSFPISFQPSAARRSTGRLIIDLETSIDTIHLTGEGLEETRSVTVVADTLQAMMCASSEGLATITNLSCRLMTLDALDIPAPLELLPGQLPIGIQAGKSVQLKVRFTPISEGPQRVDALAHLKFVGQTETIAFDTILPLNVIGLPGTPLTVTTDTTINIGDVSICAVKSFTVPIQSLGCDTLSITSTTLSALDKGYTITAMPNAIVPVNESTNATLHFTPPAAIGSYTTNLVITTNAGTRKVTLIANVVPGNKVLASSVTTLNFGETNICEERDSVIRLTNNGCDTLRITEANASDHFIVGGEYPIVLAPGQSIDVPVSTVLDTAGKPTQLSGEVIFTSTADNALPPIQLSRSLVYPTKLRLEAVDEASGKAGDIVKFRIVLEGQVPSTMTALHFDFLHNNDLLSFESLSSQDLTITSTTGNDAQVQRFTLSPVREAGVLGELSFKAFLAEAEQTTLSFDNISFEAEGVTFAPECIAVVSDSGSRFDFVYTCGDDLIRSSMNGTLLIKSITPNPASSEIRIELADGLREEEVLIVDLLGAEVLRTTSSARIDVSTLASGTYYVKVGAGGLTQTRQVVIQR